jgi:hypothetical protein
MDLRTDILAKYVGGQMEIQNQGDGYIYRGEIKTIVVDRGVLKVGFKWLAKGDTFPPTRWMNHQDLNYDVGLEIFAASSIGQDRIAMSAPAIGELVVLFPLGGSRLDPAKVERLQLT